MQNIGRIITIMTFGPQACKKSAPSLSSSLTTRVHHFPKIFESSLGHPTASGFDIVEHVYELFFNLNNFCKMHIAKENWIGDARRAARRLHCETIALSLV